MKWRFIMKNLMKGLTQFILIATLVMGMSFVVDAAETTTTAADATTAANTENQTSKPKVQKCGNKATWTYDEVSGTLTISGTGKIYETPDWNTLKIKHIQINEGITTLSSNIFSRMKKLDTVSIPDSVKKIEYGAFYGSSLKTVTIKASVTKIESAVFQKCKKLTTVNWYAKKIPSYTFSGCKSLTTVNISNNLKRIGYHAFSNTLIKSFYMPDSVTYISGSAFANCTELENLTLSRNIKDIPSYFVEDCEKLTKITLRGGVEKISSNAFSGSYIEELTLSDSVKTIETRAFAHSSIKELVIPDSVKVIQTRAFEDADCLVKVTLPNKLIKIRDSVFEGCQALETVTLGKNLKYIGESAFADCPKLKAITIPGSVKVIGYKAFEESGVEEVIIKSGVKTIDYWAFYNCDKLTSISISDTVTTLQENALVDCNKLTNINVDPDNKKYSTKDGCLLDKSQKKLIVVPAGKKGTFSIPSPVETIVSTAFYGCSKIENYSAEENSNFKTVDGILYNNSMKKLISCPSSKTGKINIPSTVTRIEESAFQHSKASYINIPDSVKSIGYCAFEYCENLKSIKIPGSVEKISNAAFWECKSLKKVTIEKGVKKISRNAFHGCEKLRKVIIPASVVKIGKSSFSDCYNLTFYCNKSSFAMAYAVKRYYIEYKLI